MFMTPEKKIEPWVNKLLAQRIYRGKGVKYKHLRQSYYYERKKELERKEFLLQPPGKKIILSPGIKSLPKSPPQSKWNNQWNVGYRKLEKISPQPWKKEIEPSMRNKLWGILDILHVEIQEDVKVPFWESNTRLNERKKKRHQKIFSPLKYVIMRFWLKPSEKQR